MDFLLCSFFTFPESLELIFKLIEQIFTVFKSLSYTTLQPKEEERQIIVALPKFKRGIHKLSPGLYQPQHLFTQHHIKEQSPSTQQPSLLKNSWSESA